MDLSYIINELGEDRSQYFNAIAPPIMQTSNFAFNKVDDLRQAFADEYSTYLYSRGINPTVDMLRKKLAALDEAEDCLVVNSGASAIFATVLANVKAGDHIISVKKPYTWAQRTFNVILPRFNVQTTYVDGTEVENFANAIQPNTKIIYLETPNSWDFALQDLKQIGALAKKHGIITICDNSYCTPLYQKPIAMGIDISIQSATKYIGGHSDTVAGVICGTRLMMERIFNSEYMTIGCGIQPFNAWLLLRGLRTLPLRLKHIAENTRVVVDYLSVHPKVDRVIFPFNTDFPQYDLAKQQMQNVCGLLTFILKADTVEEVERFCNSLKHLLMAVSWGGHESLIVPYCAVMPPGGFDAAEPMHRSIRLYVGLEEPAYIIADIEQAFSLLLEHR